MGRSDPGPHKYKECSKLENKNRHKIPQDQYWTELVIRAKTNEIVAKYHTTPCDRYVCTKYQTKKTDRSPSGQYEYLQKNLYIKSAVETKSNNRSI